MSNFTWYNAPSQPESLPFDQPSTQHLDDRQFDGLQRPISGSYPPQPFNGDGSFSHPQQVHDMVIPQHDGNNIYIHADNVIIQGGSESAEGHIPVTHGTPAVPHQTTTQDQVTGDKIKSTAVTEHPTDSNPLGVPSAHQFKAATEEHPPSDTSKAATTTTTTNPTVAPDATHSLAPPTVGAPSDKHVPSLSTDNSHTSTMPESDIQPSTNHGAPSAIDAAPGTATTSTAALPDGSSGVKMSANDHPPVNEKSKKKHKTMKERYREFKNKIHGGGKSISGDVHPKDSRDGKTLPSQNELSQRQVTEPVGNSADHPVLHKDPNDATGKSVTGSDANPSKASMPFKVPAPSLNQPPVDAKAQ